MRLACVCFFLWLGTALSLSAAPNVVLILSDDQGWQDYGFMGHEVVRTPSLDRLAERSLVFERGYVVSPLCRPSLASIMTGLHPHQHGVVANDVSPAKRGDRAKEDRPVVEHFMSFPNLATTLVEAGYLAFQSGKWWEGSYEDGGFTHGMTHGDALKGGRHGDAGLAIGRESMAPIYAFMDEAIEQDKPFFVWYAPFLPHTPHNPPAELLSRYQAKDLPENVAKYYAMCEWFDQTCGELIQAIEDRGQTENTLIVYVCDNGWGALDKTAENPEDWWNDYAPRTKGSPFEIGIRTPILLSQPGVVEPGRSQDLASSIDLLPTILRACNLTPPTDLPGIDLLSPSARQERDSIFGASYAIHNMTPGNPASTRQYRWCITKDWKLLLRDAGEDTTKYISVHRWDDVPVRLYNLQSDPGETTNLADSHPDRVRELQTRIQNWLN